MESRGCACREDTGYRRDRVFRAVIWFAPCWHQGDCVRAVGRNPAKCAELAGLGAEVISADLRDHETILAACRGMDRVCHSGALSSPWGKRCDFEAINVGGTAHVLEGCLAHGVQRLVYISSPSVLFDGQDQENLTEEAPYPARFISVYSETKKRGEELVNAARSKIETVILRPKAIFGPGDTALLPRLLAAAERKRLPQIGDGENRVDLTYVGNVVEGTLAALDSTQAIGRTYTLTNGKSPRLWDVIRHVLDAVGVSSDLRRVPLPVAYTAAALMEAQAALTHREPLLTRYSVLILARTQTYDIRAARQDLGYNPSVSISEGLERTLRAQANFPASK